MAARQGMVSLYSGVRFNSLQDSDLEHIVAMSEAHDSGLCRQSDAVKRRFASDLDNLTLATPRINRHVKRDKDAGEWQPSMNQCWFARRVVLVKSRYNLSVDHVEKAVLRDLLATCRAE